jgi:hypothetical protein
MVHECSAVHGSGAAGSWLAGWVVATGSKSNVVMMGSSMLLRGIGVRVQCMTAVQVLTAKRWG